MISPAEDRSWARASSRAASIAANAWRAVGYGFIPISSNSHFRPSAVVSRFGATAVATRPAAALRAAITPATAAIASVIQRDDIAGADATGVPPLNASAVASAAAVRSTLSPYARHDTAALPNAAEWNVGHTPSRSTVGP